MLTEVKLEKLSDDHEASLVTFVYVSVGESVKKGDPLIEIQTEKAVTEITAPIDGTVLEIFKERSDTIEVGETIFTIGNENVQALVTASVSTMESKPMEQSESKQIIKAAPIVKKRANELGISLDEIPLPKNGMLKLEDVEKFAAEHLNKSNSPIQIGRADSQLIEMSNNEKTQDYFFEQESNTVHELATIPLNAVKIATNRSVQFSNQQIPQVTHFLDINVERLVQLRQEINDSMPKQIPPLSYMPFMVKATAALVQRHWKLNCILNEDESYLIPRKDIHIGIAVQTENGLYVPVVKDGLTKTIQQIQKELLHLIDLANEARLKAPQFENCSIGISNIGSYNGSFFTPLVQKDTAAMIGIGKVEKKAIVEDDGIVIKPMLPVSFSYDHRILDGAEAQKILADFGYLLENISYTITI